MIQVSEATAARTRISDDGFPPFDLSPSLSLSILRVATNRASVLFSLPHVVVVVVVECFLLCMEQNEGRRGFDVTAPSHYSRTTSVRVRSSSTNLKSFRKRKQAQRTRVVAWLKKMLLAKLTNTEIACRKGCGGKGTTIEASIYF